jgi:hypothetical protein
MTNEPMPLTASEWEEMFNASFVRLAWGLDDDAGSNLETWKQSVSAVRFDRMPGWPGYVGELYILVGDVLPASPFVLTRGCHGELGPGLYLGKTGHETACVPAGGLADKAASGGTKHGPRFPVMTYQGTRFLIDFENERFEAVDGSGQVIGFRGGEGIGILLKCEIIECPFCMDYLMEKPIDGKGNPFCAGCGVTIRSK